MENIDKMQNKCALPGNKFRDETEGALGRFMQGQRTRPPAWQGCGGQLAPPFGKLEEDGPAFACEREAHPLLSLFIMYCANNGHQTLRCQPDPNLPIVSVSVSLHELFPPLVAIQDGGNLSLSTKTRRFESLLSMRY